VSDRGSFLRNNLFLVAAVALPVIVVAFFVVASAIPKWTVPPPAYDLVLRVGKPYEQNRPQVAVDFKVVNGRLQATARPAQKDQYVPPWRLFRFDHQTLNLIDIPVALPDSLPADSEPVTVVVDVLQGKTLLEQTRAPDGYELRTDTARGSAGIVGDLFGMRGYDQTVALINKGRVVALPLPDGYPYYSPVTVIGWLADAQQPR
jgi:hypothetical protein